MGHWSDNALRRLNKEEGDQRVKDEKFLETQRIKKAHGKPLWDQVRRIITDEAQRLNTKAEREILDFDETRDADVSINATLDTGKRDLLASFNEETGVLYWECNTGTKTAIKSGQWELAVTKDGGVQFHSGMVPSTPNSIATTLLDTLLFG